MQILLMSVLSINTNFYACLLYLVSCGLVINRIRFQKPLTHLICPSLWI